MSSLPSMPEPTTTPTTLPKVVGGKKICKKGGSLIGELAAPAFLLTAQQNYKPNKTARRGKSRRFRGSRRFRRNTRRRR